jgi:hypothetical protein
MRHRFDLDALDAYATCPDDPDRSVPNPTKKDAARKVKALAEGSPRGLGLRQLQLEVIAQEVCDSLCDLSGFGLWPTECEQSVIGLYRVPAYIEWSLGARADPGVCLDQASTHQHNPGTLTTLCSSRI